MRSNMSMNFTCIFENKYHYISEISEAFLIYVPFHLLLHRLSNCDTGKITSRIDLEEGGNFLDGSYFKRVLTQQLVEISRNSIPQLRCIFSGKRNEISGTRDHIYFVDGVQN